MNRRKKINDTLKAKAKKRNAKLHKNPKPKYISKADRVEVSTDEMSAQTTDCEK
ncbi:DUF2986 domain-containing protein [Psychrosphaera sp. B3R10]|uniref:DUF2986 domain-containing protein n=1 Tax=Psychrosphaera algicola TaxID=3023714 RepID=A0ABT5F856_9GAMM|nr:MULTISPECIES: DUF2986 domain-containing protein [unclassified Psychrosphaera]MBU2882114.1 DUF2986 domain-containing protein [Psychrosphaera sp. I2R16]MBU2988795.1 DUF2986 domain-containing protein [Psychrosphaera sp. B3R10]MDC2887729.1 DUF2986 domain-containing protein [Psychrosphaera sp. G1-22]MDO6717815.1 DUF2986 domain-containing protein [Psychrosphaera sp. 1_MG-2023]